MKAAAAAGLLCLGLSGVFAGWPGVAGMGIGLAVALVGVFALAGFTKLFAAAAVEGANPKQGAVLTTLAFAIKMPLYLLAFKGVESIGGQASACFISGVVVVYSGLVVWGMTR